MLKTHEADRETGSLAAAGYLIYKYAKFFKHFALSNRQSLAQNFTHAAVAMDDSKDKDARFHYLVDDTVGFDDNLPVLVIFGSGKLRWYMTVLGHLGKAFTCFANKSDHIPSCARIAGPENVAKNRLKVKLGLLQHENRVVHQPIP